MLKEKIIFMDYNFNFYEILSFSSPKKCKKLCKKFAKKIIKNPISE